MDNIFSKLFTLKKPNRGSNELKPEPVVAKKSDFTVPPPGRKSIRDINTSNFYDTVKGIRFISQNNLIQHIPIIRELALVDRNVGIAVHDLVLLTNTGFTIDFDPGVSPDQRDKMRKEINSASKTWVEGGSGLHTLINRLTGQIIIAGAISNEWVPKKDLSGIDFVTLVNPEDILFGLNKRTGRYEPYQYPKFVLTGATTDPLHGPIPLNEVTYKYFGFLGDTDSPYGNPILISALRDLGIQEDMLKNIAFIVKQFGLMGFVSLLLQKPSQNKDENETAYRARLTKLLTDSRDNTMAGLADGVAVGFEDDHKYEFQSIAKNASGLGEVFNLNQTLVANGLKYTPQFMGANGGTDTFVSVIFTKILSQLANIQALLAANIEVGLNLHLRLKGFNYDYLKVKFNISTVTDDLKVQQAREIRQRINRNLWDDGVISKDEYADAMGYAKPDMEEARLVRDPVKIAEESKDPGAENDKAKQKKNIDAKKTREKRTPQPIRKDGKAD